MIRKDTKAAFVYDDNLGLAPYYEFTTGGQDPIRLEIEPGDFELINRLQASEPFLLVGLDKSRNGRQWWVFEGDVFWDDDRLTVEEIHPRLLERQDREAKEIASLRRKHGLG